MKLGVNFFSVAGVIGLIIFLILLLFRVRIIDFLEQHFQAGIMNGEDEEDMQCDFELTHLSLLCASAGIFIFGLIGRVIYLKNGSFPLAISFALLMGVVAFIATFFIAALIAAWKYNGEIPPPPRFS